MFEQVLTAATMDTPREWTALVLLAVVLVWLGRQVVIPLRDAHIDNLGELTAHLKRLGNHLDVVDKALDAISQALSRGTESQQHLAQAVDEVKRDVAEIKRGLEQWAGEYHEEHSQDRDKP